MTPSSSAAPASDILRLAGLEKHFPVKRGFLARPAASLRAVDGVDLAVRRGEVLGVVGESGSGKSTLGRLVLRLLEPSGGRVLFDGTDITHASVAQLRPLRRRMQMIFQDPYSSLNQRMTVRDTLAEALVFHGLAGRGDVDDKVAALLRQVGLAPDYMRRYPRAFSGGQRQRIAIARALAVEPEFVVADEPVSALDVSIQAEIINLVDRLRRELGLTMMFISHDLSVVELLSDRVLVLYLGRPMELAPAERLFAAPHHPYTRALLAAIPGREGGKSGTRQVLEGEIPSPLAPPSGCVFRTRCPYATPDCARTVPAPREVAPGHFKACIRDDIVFS